MYTCSNTTSSIAGWPVSIGSGGATAVAFTQLIGSFGPEMVVAESDGNVTSLAPNGTVAGVNWPNPTNASASLRAMPITEKVNTLTANALIGSTDGSVYGWRNDGAPLGGWPFDLSVPLGLSAAAGDIDNDGFTEVVILAQDQMFVLDVKSPGATSRIWKMYGHDPARTGCMDCPTPSTSSVTGPAPARLRFPPPTPNPATVKVRLAYSLSGRAAVRMDVFDVSGRLVSQLVKKEQAEGSHEVTWDGRTGNGEAVPSGLYYARLTVTGPGVNEEVVRKIGWVR